MCGHLGGHFDSSKIPTLKNSGIVVTTGFLGQYSQDKDLSSGSIPRSLYTVGDEVWIYSAPGQQRYKTRYNYVTGETIIEPTEAIMATTLQEINDRRYTTNKIAVLQNAEVSPCAVDLKANTITYFASPPNYVKPDMLERGEGDDYYIMQGSLDRPVIYKFSAITNTWTMVNNDTNPNGISFNYNPTMCYIGNDEFLIIGSATSMSPHGAVHVMKYNTKTNIRTAVAKDIILTDVWKNSVIDSIRFIIRVRWSVVGKYLYGYTGHQTSEFRNITSWVRYNMEEKTIQAVVSSLPKNNPILFTNTKNGAFTCESSTFMNAESAYFNEDKTIL